MAASNVIYSAINTFANESTVLYREMHVGGKIKSEVLNKIRLGWIVVDQWIVNVHKLENGQ